MTIVVVAARDRPFGAAAVAPTPLLMIVAISQQLEVVVMRAVDRVGRWQRPGKNLVFSQEDADLLMLYQLSTTRSCC